MKAPKESRDEERDTFQIYAGKRILFDLFLSTICTDEPQSVQELRQFLRSVDTLVSELDMVYGKLLSGICAQRHMRGII